MIDKTKKEFKEIFDKIENLSPWDRHDFLNYFSETGEIDVPEYTIDDYLYKITRQDEVEYILDCIHQTHPYALGEWLKNLITE